MKNNEWNVPSDYFEKNKKALMPVQKFPTGKWILALAAACVIGVGLFMLKGENQVQDIINAAKVSILILSKIKRKTETKTRSDPIVGRQCFRTALKILCLLFSFRVVIAKFTISKSLSFRYSFNLLLQSFRTSNRTSLTGRSFWPVTIATE